MALQGSVETTSNIEAVLLALDTAISPPGIVEFLTTRVDPYMRSRAAARFQNEGDDAVGKWSPLRPSTVAIRQDLGFPGGHPINKREGELEAYIVGTPGLVTSTERGGFWQMPGRPPGNAELAKKFRTAQQGASDPHTTPRPVIGQNEADMRQVLTLLMFHIGEAV